MSEWQPIETAPTDGSEVQLKRVYQDRLVVEGTGVFGYLHEAAPSRSCDLATLFLMAGDAKFRKAQEDYVKTQHWLKPDRMYLFPAPTHWKSL